MKVVVVSDTHKEYHGLLTVVQKNQDAGLIVHLGDGEYEFRDVSSQYPQKPFVFVRGNCDYCEGDDMRIITVSGYRILCTHGHRYNVSDGLEYLVAVAKQNNCQVVLYGHTHIYKTECTDGVFVMNPGSLKSPRGHNPATYGILEIKQDGTINMNILEAPKPPEKPADEPAEN